MVEIVVFGKKAHCLGCLRRTVNQSEDLDMSRLVQVCDGRTCSLNQVTLEADWLERTRGLLYLYLWWHSPGAS